MDKRNTSIALIAYGSAAAAVSAGGFFLLRNSPSDQGLTKGSIIILIITLVINIAFVTLNCFTFLKNRKEGRNGRSMNVVIRQLDDYDDERAELRAEIVRLKKQEKRLEKQGNTQKDTWQTELAALQTELAATQKRLQIVNQEKMNYETEHKVRLIQVMNLEGVRAYFQISKWHANLSFAFSSLACIGGLAAIGYGIWAAVNKPETNAAVIATVGSAVSAFITATVFWVHRKSAEQLNRYYDSLHEVEVFLSSVDVVELISEKKRDAAYMRILDELYNIQKIKAAKPEKYDPPKKPEDKPSTTKPKEG